jgi:hypothetical protein
LQTCKPFIFEKHGAFYLAGKAANKALQAVENKLTKLDHLASTDLATVTQSLTKAETALARADQVLARSRANYGGLGNWGGAGGFGKYQVNLMDQGIAVSKKALQRRLAREGSVAVYGDNLVNSFKNTGEVIERLGNLRNSLIKSGLDDVKVGIRGSAVTEGSSKGGSFRWIQSPSDIDFFLVSNKLEKMIGEGGFKAGIGRINALNESAPEVAKILEAFGKKTTERLGRGANVLPIKQDLFNSLEPTEYILR